MATKDTFYITTPIYYVNDVPHLGHAYTTVNCDVIARYRRLRGERVFFLTGTDEHGQKNAQAAQERGVSAQEWVDSMLPRWKEVWERLEISYDDFIRTTEERHERPVQQFAQALYDKGDIYLGTYEGPYCVSCEEFKVESELVDGNCPIHERPVERIAEDNYFFALSRYQDALLELYERRPEFIQPEVRRNEVVSFVGGGLQDISFSRVSFEWGVPVPWDDKHVIYVWIDALQNYITAAGYGTDAEAFERRWPADAHVVGKDIIRFHCVIWPAMLMAAGLPLPRTVFAHGWWLVGGEKMSKTKLTGIHPFQLVDQFGVDAYRYYFVRQTPFGQDGNFSWETMLERYNGLANGLGNLASRVLAMTASYFEGVVPEPSSENELSRGAARVLERFEGAIGGFDPSAAAVALDDFVRDVNRYLVDVEPWQLAKDPERRGELADSLYAALEALRLIAVLASPIMPSAAARLWEQLGVAEPLHEQRVPAAARWGLLEPGTRTTRGDALFPRLEE